MFTNYREPELQFEDIDASASWVSICEKLELEGQLSLIKRQDETQGNPIPYMPINKRWLKIFKTICPDHVEYQKYSFSTIPMDGLIEIGLCVEKNLFDTIQIWWDNKEKDPLIIGIVKGRYSTDNKHFLIGRFGDEVLPLEELEKKAIARLETQLKNDVIRVSKTISETVSNYLDNDNDTVIRVSNGHTYLYGTF